MGLDMYLSKKIYIWANFNHTGAEGVIDITIKGKPVNINFNKVEYVTEEVCYWRKANQIHAWFVEHVQNGVDNCGNYEVSVDDLRELISDCKQVLDRPELAADILPTRSGFFFGSTDYDEDYFEELKYTVETLEEALKDLPDAAHVQFEYTSSW